jgi:hypothetical protein
MIGCGCNCCPGCSGQSELVDLETLDVWAKACGVRGAIRSYRVTFDPWADRWECVLKGEHVRAYRGYSASEVRALAADAIRNEAKGEAHE